MHRDELIRFITNNFTEDDHLVFQVMNKNDIDRDLNEDVWVDFVCSLDGDGDLYDEFNLSVENKLDEYKQDHCADEMEEEFI
jgi:hypothetical protein